MNYFIAFVVALILTPVVRQIAVRCNITDKPKGDALKIHDVPVALMGGSAVFVACIAGIIAGLSKIEFTDPYVFLWILNMGCVIACIGLWDDIKHVYPGLRLLVHFIAALVIVCFDIKLLFPFVWISGIISVLIIVSMINAYNMIDGMDGLCAGLSIVSCIGFFIIGMNQHNSIIQVLAGTLCMVLVGFLPYNFHKATIFLGDAGSGFIGFIMGIMVLLAFSKVSFLTVFALMFIVGLPLFDIIWAVVRRIIEKKPLFKGDRNHIYDILLKRGMSQKKVWIMLCGVQIVCVGLALCFLSIL